MTPGFSPDGRWLTAVHHSHDFDVPHTAHLLDLDTGQEKTITDDEYFTLAWSTDGQWFVRRNSEQSLIVTAPAVNYRLLVPHEFGGCYRPFWQ
jgi:Tol biopolymer transport system component